MPFLLAFFFGQGIPLVNLVMAFQAQSSYQVVISLHPPAFAPAPIGVGSLNHVA
jgi:hypothetical protein